MQDDNNRVPDNPEARAFRKDHWTIDKFSEQAEEAVAQGKSLDGIIAPGAVDKEQIEFLKTTDMVKEEVKEDGR